MNMKILIITGSPHKDGASSLLAEEFKKGAEEAGHEVYRFDAAFKDVHPCIACEKCHNGDEICVFKDDMEELNPKLIMADAVIFATPVYYYSVSSQLKTVIDRFYANDEILHMPKDCAVLLPFADETKSSADAVIETFKKMSDFLGWNMVGSVKAPACSTVAELMKTDAPRLAYELGKSMKH